jgi:hypothetical protein
MEQMPTMVQYNKIAKSGKKVFRVTTVINGSIFDKAGYKVGDLVMNGKSPEK